jgi:hypothetical protein
LIPTGERSGLWTRTGATGRRFVVHSDEILTAFVELERQALTVSFYLESIHAAREWSDNEPI